MVTQVRILPAPFWVAEELLEGDMNDEVKEACRDLIREVICKGSDRGEFHFVGPNTSWIIEVRQVEPAENG